MKNFDEERQHRAERDRTFQINGEAFTYRPSIAPEVLADWNDAVSGNAGPLNERAWLGLYDATIVAILEPGQEEKWQRVRDPNAEIPVNLSDLSGVMEWLLAEQSGRPTTSPSDSSQTDGETATASTESSSPEPAVASPA